MRFPALAWLLGLFLPSLDFPLRRSF